MQAFVQRRYKYDGNMLPCIICISISRNGRRHHRCFVDRLNSKNRQQPGPVYRRRIALYVCCLFVYNVSVNTLLVYMNLIEN